MNLVWQNEYLLRWIKSVYRRSILNRKLLLKPSMIFYEIYVNLFFILGIYLLSRMLKLLSVLKLKMEKLYPFPLLQTVNWARWSSNIIVFLSSYRPSFLHLHSFLHLFPYFFFLSFFIPKVQISTLQIGICEVVLKIAKTCDAVFLSIAKLITLCCETVRYVVRHYAMFWDIILRCETLRYIARFYTTL